MRRGSAPITNTTLRTSFEYDVEGRLTAVVDALGGRTRYAYDEAGNRVSVPAVEDVLASARHHTYGRGEILFHEGDPGDSVHLIARGHFALWCRAPAGALTTLRIFGPGAACGHTNPRATGPARAATVAALEGGETWELRQSHLEGMLARYPTMLDAAAAIMMREFDRIASHLHDLLHVDAAVRVRRRLDSLVEQYLEAGAPMRITVSKEDPPGSPEPAAARSTACSPRSRRPARGFVPARVGYDADGNRVRRSVNGATTRFLVDTMITRLAQPLEERDATGALVARHTYGHRRISTTSGAGSAFYLGDALGSTRLLTDAAGTVTDTYDYDAHGNLVAQTGTTNAPNLFTGERFEPSVGLYDLRARNYAPGIGRFYGRDPESPRLSDPRSAHPFLYAHADPVNLTRSNWTQHSGRAGGRRRQLRVEHGVELRHQGGTGMPAQGPGRRLRSGLVFFSTAPWQGPRETA